MIYVDSMLLQADVRTAKGFVHSSRWSHLFSDQLDPSELHAFAKRIGMKREWFQEGTRLGRPDQRDPVKDHYDVTEGRRKAAIRAGAVEVDRDQAVAIWRAKREAFSALTG